MRWQALYSQDADSGADVLGDLVTRVPEAEILDDFPYLGSADNDASLQFATAQNNHTILATAFFYP